ncbi:hypothetical protein J3A83DRAFT_4368692 [Scleroderma citrinum]
MSLTRAKTPTWTEELLRQSLLSEELIDVRFHLFSSRSKTSRKAVNPRTLHANAVLLKKSANYFADLLGPEMSPSGTVLMDVKLDDEIFSGLALGDYGYESDSDLEDEDNDEDEDEESENKDIDKADTSGTNSFVSAVAGSEKDYDLLEKESSNASSTPTGPTVIKFHAIVPTLNKGRHIFIKDTAFQTWYCLLYYLYTGGVHLLPPKSWAHGSPWLSLDANEEPRCSAKSMFRLASKLNLDELREHAFTTLNQCVDERNLLQELAGGFVGIYPRVLEMELNMLSEKIATIPIVKGLPALMRRISQKEFPHGAEIIIGLHTRILQLHYADELADTQLRTPSPQPVPPPANSIWAEENGVPADDPVYEDHSPTSEAVTRDSRSYFNFTGSSTSKKPIAKTFDQPLNGTPWPNPAPNPLTKSVTFSTDRGIPTVATNKAPLSPPSRPPPPIPSFSLTPQSSSPVAPDRESPSIASRPKAQSRGILQGKEKKRM